jgi:hypothetical protein
MKRLLALFTLAAAVLVAGCASYSPSEGWVTLIEGDKGMENFDRIGDADWRTEGGAIVATKGKGGYLVSKKSYKDFDLYVEFWANQVPRRRFLRSRPQKSVLTALRSQHLITPQVRIPDRGIVIRRTGADGLQDQWRHLPHHGKGPK